VLCLWPANFTLEGDGTLQPAEKRDVFAPIDGTITDVEVAHSDMVDEGQEVAKMRNTELQVTYEKALGEFQATAAQMFSKQRQLSDIKKHDDYIRLSSELDELKKQNEGLGLQLALLKEKRELLKINSPIKGQVITPFKVRDTLLSRTVRAGQVLMTVADPDKDWELEIEMPDHRMGHIAEAREALQAKEPGKDLEVTYILNNQPGRKLKGVIKDIHMSAEVHGEQGNTVMILVAVNKDDFTDRRPGEGVKARVSCGRASLGYVLFHDVIEFIQTKVLFRL